MNIVEKMALVPFLILGFSFSLVNAQPILRDNMQILRNAP
jgi:hypothetical protein